MSQLWAAAAARKRKNDYTSGSSRWVSNELNNQFMISFHLIHQFIEENQIYHESLGTLMDGIYLGTFDPDIIRKEQVPDLTEAKSPIKETPLRPISGHLQSSQAPSSLLAVNTSKATFENTQSHFSNLHIEYQPPLTLKPSLKDSDVVVFDKASSYNNSPNSESKDGQNRQSDGLDDSFQAISKAIRKSIAGRVGDTIFKQDLSGLDLLPNRSSSKSQYSKLDTTMQSLKSDEKSLAPKTPKSRSSMFIALPTREPIVIKSVSRRKLGVSKRRTMENTKSLNSDQNSVTLNTNIKSELNNTTVSTKGEKQKFEQMSPVKLPVDKRVFREKVPMLSTGEKDDNGEKKVDKLVERTMRKEEEHVEHVFTLPEVEHEKPIVSVTRKVENEELVVQSTDPKDVTNDTVLPSGIWSAIGKYRSLSPVRKPLFNSKTDDSPRSILASTSRSRSRSRSRSPLRKEVLVHRKNSRSPRHELFRGNSPTSPSKLTANGGESDLINRLTAPTSSSAAKSKSQNRKTDGRKPERNKFLTTTLIPTTGGNNKAKEVSPIKLKSEPYRFPKLETSSIPTLKMSMMEKRSETTLSKTRQKYIIKPTNTFKRKSELGKEKHEHSIIPQHTHLSEDQKLETNPQTTLGSTTQDRKSEQRIKRIKTANGVALPEAARGLLNKDNANKKSIASVAITPARDEIRVGNNVLPVTPTRISPRNLPEIDSDEEGDFSKKKILQPWADSPILRRSIAASRSIDPATVITNNPKIDLHETFQSVVSAKRGQESPAATPNMRQQEKDMKRYFQQLGYIQ